VGVKWLDFEKMIAQIYQTLSPKATVTHNDFILGVKSDAPARTAV
jgi:hypothetical protein